MTAVEEAASSLAECTAERDSLTSVRTREDLAAATDDFLEGARAA